MAQSTPLDALMLTRSDWTSRRAAHEKRVDGWLRGDLARRERGGRHSIEEFLFTYYSYRPAQLRRWLPGALVSLEEADPAEFGKDHVQGLGGRLRVDLDRVMERRRGSFEWIYELLKATNGRQPHFGCFGMHEWAMVYRQTQEEMRHNMLPLRLSAEEAAEVVDANKVKCSHFDAFRFFTPAARPLNLIQPTRETQIQNEQPACLHAAMDTYRWAHKLAPLTSSDLIADCFELAREVRTLDMRASPYDLTSLSLEPLKVETPEGRAEYVVYQRDFAVRAGRLRESLIEVCRRVL